MKLLAQKYGSEGKGAGCGWQKNVVDILIHLGMAMNALLAIFLTLLYLRG